MSKIQLSFENIKESKSNIDVISFLMTEKEGDYPKTSVKIPNSNYDLITPGAQCALVDDDTPIFIGQVSKTLKTQDYVEVILIKKFREIPIEVTTTDPDLMNLLYNNEDLEIPEVFCKLHVPYYDRVSSDPSIVSLINPSENPIDVSDKIIANSLLIDKSTDNTISSLDLEIASSWIARVEGEVDISSKIAKRFKGGKINTLTPKSLESSWPRFGDRISGIQSARKTKYYVGHSRFAIENILHMTETDMYTPRIDIIPDIKCRLKRYWYNHKFSICFAYEQYRKENIKLHIKNNRFQDGVSKKIKINLHSVQEYLENDYISSFFRTELGTKAYKHITKMASLYIASSMRDLTISFSIPYIKEITCKDWIIIQGMLVKISALQFNSNKTIDIKAIGFSNEDFRVSLSKSNEITTTPSINAKEICEIDVGNIIHDIVVENDGYTQTEKLFSFLQENSGKLTKSNYKQLINNFLNQNKTLITVITKPLKTKYCEQTVIDLGEVCIN